MSRKMIASLMVAVFCVSLLSGCAPSAKIALTFAPQQTAHYESASKMIKDVEFDQPSLKKNKKEQVSTNIMVKFDQTIAQVRPDGTAIADITIRAIQFKQVSKNEVRYDVDSTAEKSKNDPLCKIVGQSYRIAMDPNGAVKVIDATKARAVISGDSEQKSIAQKILSDESIIERHQLPLPNAGQNMISAGKNWTRVVPSPPGLLAPKVFEKVYTVSEVGKDKTVITMSAKENLKQKVEGPKNAGNMGFLAKMFDNQDDYTGKIVLNMTGGAPEEYNETLVSSYTAQDKPTDTTKENAAPDTLIMRLTYGISLKKVN